MASWNSRNQPLKVGRRRSFAEVLSYFYIGEIEKDPTKELHTVKYRHVTLTQQKHLSCFTLHKAKPNKDKPILYIMFSMETHRLLYLQSGPLHF